MVGHRDESEKRNTGQRGDKQSHWRDFVVRGVRHEGGLS